MSTRSLNKVMLIGNLTRDPELRYTPAGTAVCSFGLATNRSWTTESGEKKEEAEFHRIVAWNKLAELCSQLLTKGRKVYVEGRLQTRSWQAQDQTQRTSTEVVIEDMIILDPRRTVGEEPTQTIPTEVAPSVPQEQPISDTASASPTAKPDDTKTKKAKKEEKEETEEQDEQKKDEEINPDDIPF